MPQIPLHVIAAHIFALALLFNAGFQVALAQETPPENMVLVPAGEFLMGADNAEAPQLNQPRLHSDARPLHKATTGAFYLDKTEVTNAQYQEFCRATGIAPPAHWTNGEIPSGQQEVAVTRVDWYQATAYARWAGKRLPSEAEWEKAARGTDGRLYPWGETFEASRLVWNALSAGKVGAHPTGASPYGALDMAGNVFEWTSDWYRAYPRAPFLFPEYGTQFKVIRGGGFGGFDFMTRTYYRAVASQRTRSEWLGFRCVRDVKTAK